MRAGRVAAVSCLVFTGALLAVSCSTSPPQIAQTFWQVDLVHNPRTKASHEALSLFVHVTDNQGISDLDSIYLISDSSELYWKLDSANWQYSDENGELWVGSNMIQMPDRQTIPRGRYRVLLSNLAGERATDEIFLSADHLDPAQMVFPSLMISSTTVTLSSHPVGTMLRAYGQNGALIGVRSAATIPLASLAPKNSSAAATLTLFAYVYDKNCGCGLLTGPYHPGSPG